MTRTFEIRNIYDLIDLLEKRPAMYLGDKNISCLRSFLDGYQFAQESNKPFTEEVFPPFWYFHEWAMHQYGWGESTAGWKNILLDENGGDEEKALDDFFRQVKVFKELVPVSIRKATLTKENLEFHFSDACGHKRYVDVVNQIVGPLHNHADEVFIIEFSHQFGFSVFVRSKNEWIGHEWMDRFKHSEDAIKLTEYLFGKQLNWSVVKGDLLEQAKLLVNNKVINH